MKALYSGAGLAVLAGLLMGATMRPDLESDGRPAGPQILAGSSGARSTGPFYDGGLAFAAYSNTIPDYVVGTDWQRMTAEPVAYAEPQERATPTETQPEPAPQFAAATYQEPPREGPSYPSMDGNRWYEEQRQQQRAQVEQQRSADQAAVRRDAVAQIDDEAPPEATGDTTKN